MTRSLTRFPIASRFLAVATALACVVMLAGGADATSKGDVAERRSEGPEVPRRREGRAAAPGRPPVRARREAGRVRRCGGRPRADHVAAPDDAAAERSRQAEVPGDGRAPERPGGAGVHRRTRPELRVHRRLVLSGRALGPSRVRGRGGAERRRPRDHGAEHPQRARLPAQTPAAAAGPTEDPRDQGAERARRRVREPQGAAEPGDPDQTGPGGGGAVQEEGFRAVPAGAARGSISGVRGRSRLGAAPGRLRARARAMPGQRPAQLRRRVRRSPLRRRLSPAQGRRHPLALRHRDRRAVRRLRALGLQLAGR